MKPRPILLAVTSDQHTGSTLGVCPPEGVRLDDGGCYTPSKPQLWLWEKWELYWKKVAEVRRQHRADLWVVFNGDLMDSPGHHGTSQTISLNPDAQSYVATRVFGVPRALKPDRTFVIRGTEAHAGVSGSAEEAMAKTIGAERNSETATWSSWRLRLNAHGNLVDFQHHGRMSQRPWGKQNALSLLAFQIWTEHTLRKWPPPDLAFRSHLHQFGDSFAAFPTRVIQTPAWQLKTSYAHKVAAESIADVGGVIAVVQPSGAYDIQPILSLPALPKVV